MSVVVPPPWVRGYRPTVDDINAALANIAGTAYADQLFASVHDLITAGNAATLAAAQLLYQAGDTATLSSAQIFSSNADNAAIQAINPGLFNIIASGGTTASSLAIMLGRRLTVRDFGAVGNGISDDTVAIQAALNYFGSAGGGTLYIPQGVYNYTRLTIPDGVIVVGSGTYSATLRSTVSNGTCIAVGAASGLDRVQFLHSVVRSSGATVALQGNSSFVSNFQMSGYYIGISMSGTDVSNIIVGPRAVLGNMFQPSTAGSGGAAIIAEHYSSILINDVIITGTPSGPQPDSGIRLQNGDTSIISDCNVTRHGRGLYICPGAGENTFATGVVNCLFDSAGQTASAEINPLGGSVYQTAFSNVWFGLSATGEGCLVTSMNGTINAVDFTGCRFPGNHNSGLRIDRAANVQVVGGWAAGGIDGIYISSSTDVSITGFRAGPAGTYGANSGYGVHLDGTTDYVTISGGNLRGNTTGGVGNFASGTHFSLSPAF